MKEIFFKIKNLYNTHKEAVNYLVFGFLSFLVCMITYYLCRLIFDIFVSNFISWIVAVLFAYITNKKFVFESKSNNKKQLLKEFSSFVISRIFTLILETLILYIMADLMKINDLIVKVIAQFVVILTNYILSKLIVFKKGKEK